MDASSGNVLVTDEDGESVSIIPDDVVEVGPGVGFVEVDPCDVVASVGVVVKFVSCVAEVGAVELDVQFSPLTMDVVAPKRSDLMKFMQYAKDPTVEVLKHSFFLLLASTVAFVKFWQLFGTGASHSFKGFSF